MDDPADAPTSDSDALGLAFCSLLLLYSTMPPTVSLHDVFCPPEQALTPCSVLSVSSA